MGEKHHDIFTKCREFAEVDRIRALGVYPFFRSIEGYCDNRAICDGRPLIMIGSNNYLGLANDERVLDAAVEAIRTYGSGCTGSRFLNGTLAIHEQLEEELADFVKKEAALVFSTGFFANQGALATLMEKGDYILCDRENHASIIDGCRFSEAKTIPFAHNSPESLEKRLSRLPAEGGRLVVVDGVFSMSGDLADLPAIAAVAKRHGARIYVDEAHSLGVFGPSGEGAAHHYGMGDDVDIIMGTFSKSLGSMGGFLAGPRRVIEYLKHKARCFIFTAALAPAIVGGVIKALQLVREEPERIQRLWGITRKMHEGFRSMGFSIGNTASPIVPILIGSETKAFLFCKMLYEAGIFTTPAIYPAVRYGEAIIRTSYMATHTDGDLDYVLETFDRIARELGIFEDTIYTEGTRRRRSHGYDFSLQE
jgi:8-amino-7-oxononanoate synthase